MEYFSHFLLFYSYKPKFLLKEKEKLITKTDILFSTLTIIFCFYLCFKFFGELLFHESIYFYVNVLKEGSQPIDFSNNNYRFLFGLENSSRDFFIDDTIYYIDAKQFKGIYNPKENSINYSNTNITVIKCSETNFKFESVGLSKINPEKRLCFENQKNLSVVGEGQLDNEYNYILVNIHKCKNTTENNNKCKTDDEIKSALEGAYFSMQFTDINIAPNDYYNPVDYIGSDVYTTIDARSHKEVVLYFSSVKFHNNVGIFSSVEEHYFTFDYLKENTVVKDTDLLGRIFFRSSRNTYIYTREYYKLYQIISYIYANVNTFIFVLRLILYLIEEYFFKLQLTSYFFFVPFTQFKSENNNGEENNEIFNSNINQERRIKIKKKNNPFQFHSLKVKMQPSPLPTNINLSKTELNNLESRRNVEGKKNSHNTLQLISPNRNIIKTNSGNINIYSALNNQFQIQEEDFEMSSKQGNKRVSNIDLIALTSRNLRKTKELNIPFSKKNKKKFCFEFGIILRLLICNKKEYKRKKMINELGKNIYLFFDIIRYFKLFNDIEYMKNALLNQHELITLDNEEKFYLNSKMLVNIIKEK